jgi:hypothetical protein
MTREEFVDWVRENRPEVEDEELLSTEADKEIAEVREHDPVLADKMQAVIVSARDLAAYFKEIGAKYDPQIS